MDGDGGAGHFEEDAGFLLLDFHFAIQIAGLFVVLFGLVVVVLFQGEFDGRVLFFVDDLPHSFNLPFHQLELGFQNLFQGDDFGPCVLQFLIGLLLELDD